MYNGNRMWKCRLLGVYYSLRYGRDMLKHGHFLLGHDFVYSDEVCGDHWVMYCTRCGYEAHIDEAPQKS